MVDARAFAGSAAKGRHVDEGFSMIDDVLRNRRVTHTHRAKSIPEAGKGGQAARALSERSRRNGSDLAVLSPTC